MSRTGSRLIATATLTGMLLASAIFASSPASAVPTGLTGPVWLSRSADLTGLTSKPHKVTVPSNYVYNPKLGSQHDYCTDAPDEFPAPHAKNADFRGPCARHDLCRGTSTKKSVCDNALRVDLDTNCKYYYGKLNPLRYACETTADVYWAAVVIATH